MQISDSLTAVAVSIGACNGGGYLQDRPAIDWTPRTQKSLGTPASLSQSTCNTTRTRCSAPHLCRPEPLPLQPSQPLYSSFRSRDSGWHRCSKAQVHTKADGVPSVTRLQASFELWLSRARFEILGNVSRKMKNKREWKDDLHRPVFAWFVPSRSSLYSATADLVS